jgi:hypothetical protein
VRYIVELKEPPWRRLLRHCLWAFLIIAAVALVVSTTTGIIRYMAERQVRLSAGALAQYSPAQAVIIAERLYRQAPADATLLSWIKIASRAQAWELADFIIEPLRGANDLRTQAYNITILANRAPEVMAEAIAQLQTKSPNNSEEQLMLIRVAALQNTPDDLRQKAMHESQKLEAGPLRDRARLINAQLAIKSGDNSRAGELAAGLVGRNLDPRESVELLRLLENLQRPESDEYRSALRVRARSSVPMALLMSEYLRLYQSDREVAAWLGSLPPEVAGTNEIKLRRLELLAAHLAEASDIIDTLAPQSFQQALRQVVAGQSPALDELGADELLRLGELCKDLGQWHQALRVFLRLNTISESAWSLSATAESAARTDDIKNAKLALEQLSERLGENKLVGLRRCYLELLYDDSPSAQIYRELTGPIAEYKTREEYATTLALAHYRIGNLTDALLAMTATPRSPEGKLVKGLLLAKAGQYEPAADLLKQVNQSQLLPAENRLYQTATKLLQGSSPVQRWLELLKQN